MYRAAGASALVNIKAICFDFDGTLAHFTGDFERLTDGLRSDLGLVLCDANELSLQRAQVERRGGPMTFGDTVSAALERLELRVPDDLEHLAAQVVADYSEQMALLPGALDVLTFCRNRGIPLALLTNGPADMQDPRLDIVGKADLKGLPPATVITDEIDPLRSEGQALAEKLRAAGVSVNAQDYAGVTHEFFGMGLVVGKAKQAEDIAVKDLKAAFAK